MKDAGLRVVLDENRGAMHHKVIVIDGETVVTGSYNFSKNAETRNNENLLIIKGNREIAEAYLAEFERIIR
jgi:phosphatidylserine/phosphatidylglycerophosphate/cardiolipin synthase-like enzyme